VDKITHILDDSSLRTLPGRLGSKRLGGSRSSRIQVEAAQVQSASEQDQDSMH
jgi:hypothetical protein